MKREKARRRRVRIGDVFEVVAERGLAYGQLTHRPPRVGHLIRILPGVYGEKPDGLAELVQGPTAFHTFYPLQTAVNQGIVEIVTNQVVPLADQPFPLFRAAGGIDRAGKVLNWWLWDGVREWRLDALAEDQRRLPVREIVNHALLVAKIGVAWRPENDPDLITWPAS